MPASIFHIRTTCRHVTVAFFIAIALCGCMTNKKSADASKDPVQAEGEQPLQAKGGTTASTHYVDPVIAKASSQQQAKAGLPGSPTEQPSPTAASAFPPTPVQASGSIAGLTTQPTGVRAGSFSIFSAGAAPSTAAPNTGAVPSGPGISATTGSVYTSHQPPASTACPTDSAGLPLNC
ncbi:hypothetical protein EPK99_18250 [Neorhizobium lilium]|uniref:Uncharacterized protein n=1 Tax=Neorhizobium lilium TaxID=2503024 RepID=A0A3S3S392_9HYPH|nr:hypothetical protein [Neorhizobium lilium]RWX75636.1 hypothetical protein EPK99_18250 [Neorhizobium lilium]